MFTRMVAVIGALVVFNGAARGGDPGPVRGLERMDAWFAAHPERIAAPGSGWKPFQRMRLLLETRVAPDGVSAAGARYDAWRIKRKREPLGRSRGAAQWFAAGPALYAGRCTAVAFDPSDAATVYVGAATGGLWKSTNGGDTWTPLTDDLPSISIGAVTVLPSDPDVVLVGTGEGVGVAVWPNKGPFGVGILKSTDGGVTWSPTSLTYGIGEAHGFNAIAANPITGTVLAGANDGLWRSTDDGDTWMRVVATGNVFDVKWQPGSASRVYIAKGRDPYFNFGTDNGVWVSTDDGLTFSLAGTGQPSQPLIAKTKIAVTPDDPNAIYANYTRSDNFQSLGVYRSLDAGATWQLRDGSTNMVGSQGWYNLSLAADPNDVDRILTGGVNLRLSTDGGLTYTQIDPQSTQGTATIPHVDHHAAVWEPGTDDNVWVATDGGPWKSSDDGVNWFSRREGIVSYQFFDICVAQQDPFFMMGGTQDNGVPRRLDMTTWTGPSGPFGDGGVCNVDAANNNLVYAESQFGFHFRSLNAGVTWSFINGSLTGNATYVAATDLDPADGNRLFTSTSDGIFRTTQGGVAWTNVASHTARWISISPADGDVVWTVSNASGVRYTTDGGDTWSVSAAFPASGQETKIQAHPTEPNMAFVTVGGYATNLPHVLLTTDQGASWTDATGDLPDMPVNTLVVDPARPAEWYVGTDLGVWMSTDNGASWVPMGGGLPNVLVMDLEIRNADRKLVAGTHGRGVWEIDLPAVVDVAESPLWTSPNLMLDAPQPNPVRGAALFRFAARSDASVTLAVFTISGRLVDRLGELGRGDGVIRTVRWETDGIAPGVYLAVLRSGNERTARKVVIGG